MTKIPPHLNGRTQAGRDYLAQVAAELTASHEARGGKLRVNDADEVHLFLDCPRCGGRGRIEGFGHIESGRCFKCGGARGRWWDAMELAKQRTADERSQLRSVAKAQAEARERFRRLLGWARWHREALKDLRAMRGDRFGADLRRQLIERGSLTEKQLAALRRAAEQARNAPEQGTVASLGTGRVDLQAVVVSIKETDWGTKLLLAVQAEDGEVRLYGTRPGSLQDACPGDRVELRAAVKPSDRDPAFGFYSRPTCAARVAGPGA